jgi:hypothetical protein
MNEDRYPFPLSVQLRRAHRLSHGASPCESAWLRGGSFIPPPLSTAAAQLHKPAALFPPIELCGLFFYICCRMQQYGGLRCGLFLCFFIFVSFLNAGG